MRANISTLRLARGICFFARQRNSPFVSRHCFIPNRRLWMRQRPSRHGDREWTKIFFLVSGIAVANGAWFMLRQGRTLLEGHPTKHLGAEPTLPPQASDAMRNNSNVDGPGQLMRDISTLPQEKAILTTAPDVPPTIERHHPVLLQVSLETTIKLTKLTSSHKYEQWTFNNTVPGPFIRARVGDVLELSLTNRDETGNPHNIDCHAVLGPGGGSAVTTVSEGDTKTGRFKLLCPGLYIYHCAAAPVPVHIANGMYGLILVQPEDDATHHLSRVDREYYVMQSEFYYEPPEKDETGKPSSIVEFSYPNGLREEPDAVFFNGHEAAMTRDKPLKARTGETVRIYFGNAGPNLTSSFHVIGSNFRRLYRDGDLVSAPAQFVQTTTCPLEEPPWWIWKW
ncbi:hypothetical protein AOCH_001945 [Aspergillus ochraceoroseus]|uniref:Copper-containing nitrite reductase n=1 Tax=Aspergillus ochraceoroseus TaxID=138278 RepID=A0A0F8V5M9_9EURO|nr:hypothetical protein AOCH_001945 [Aspergillus ochraceoroseus]